MIAYHYQHWKLWLCNLLFCMWNANDENHKRLTHNWLKGKRIAAVGCRAISSAHVGNVGLYHSSSGTTSMLTVQYFQLLFRKISHEGHVLFFIFAAMASPLPPSSSSVLSNSSVLTVVAYLYSTLPWSLLHLQSLQDSIFTVFKMRTPYGREGKLGDACSEHEFLSYHQVFGCAGLSSNPTMSFLMKQRVGDLLGALAAERSWAGAVAVLPPADPANPVQQSSSSWHWGHVLS